MKGHDMVQSDASPHSIPRQFFIQGITRDGRIFRPSDWAERLAGAMSCFRPSSARGPNDHLQYSPFVRPALLDGIRSVLVNEALHDLEPLAYEFVVNFARDNDLQVIDACSLPDDDRQVKVA